MTAAALPARGRTVLVGAVAALAALTGCGGAVGGVAGAGDSSASRQVSPAASASVSVPNASELPDVTEEATAPSRSAPDKATPDKEDGTSRCHTSELRASLGRGSPGAGQRNYPLVLTNASGRTCTLHGYPGAAFVDAAGGQLGPDPRREPERATTVRLAPGQHAWAGLSFSDPRISGAEAATPAALLITPPDEFDQLRVVWTAGPVPVAGNASTVHLTVVRPGTGS
ncbi:DUF4232 domain-containing protein [Streptomyces sp. NPDC006997]|uniref:DUF4232 domain-containing protein n=1 Tax=Streptomyces sp. NPDC006997 TaxID=3155356 RepID=UPI0033E67B88